MSVVHHLGCECATCMGLHIYASQPREITPEMQQMAKDAESYRKIKNRRRAMGVVQTNTFTCDVCGKVEKQSQELVLYSDPVVMPPLGWDYRKSDDKLACPDCLDK